METNLFDRDESLAIAKINHAESLAIAKIVNFDQDSEVGQSYIGDSSIDISNINLNALNKDKANKARFYIALGLFVWDEYLEKGKTVPKEVEDWYIINTWNTCADNQDNFYSELLAA